MARLPLACMLLSLSLALARPLRADDASLTIVYPTGVWPDDVQAVQAAVSVDGEVLLKAVDRSGTPTAFNFGTPERLPGRRVLIEANVVIRGETVDGHRTTIAGGLAPFRGNRPFNRWIEHLDFQGPALVGLSFQAAKDELVILDTRVAGVVPLPGRFTESQGILIAGTPTTPVAGRVRLENDRFDLSDSPAQFRFGIQLDQVQGDVELAGNEVSIGQTPVAGRLIDSEGIALVRCHGEVRVHDNLVTLGANEVFVGIGGYGDADAFYKIVGNRVRNDSLFGDAIALYGGGVDSGVAGGAIVDNEIAMSSTYGGAISLYGVVSGVDVMGNQIQGQGNVGLVVSSFTDPADPAVGNRFNGNDLEHFLSQTADVYLDANSSDTLVRGDCRTVIDLGAGNSVRCEHGD